MARATLRADGTYAVLGDCRTRSFGSVTHLANGQITFTPATNFAGDAVINYTIKDADGSQSTSTLTVHVTDTNNQAPVITSGDTFEVAENSTAVTTVVATDADTTGEAITYSITGGADHSLFNIDENTGELSFVSPPDFETQAHTYHVEVTASDGVNTSTPQLITVNLTDQNEFAVSAPIDSDAAANAVNENVAVGTVVGVTALASDADATNNGVTYALTSNPGGLFQIDANTGVVTTAAAIDREVVGASVDIEVTATSADGSATPRASPSPSTTRTSLRSRHRSTRTVRAAARSTRTSRSARWLGSPPWPPTPTPPTTASLTR